MRYLPAVWPMVLTAAAILTATGTASAEAPRAIVLLQSEGYVHDVVKPRGAGPSVVEEVLSDLGKRSGAFQPVFTRDAGDLTREALREADLVILYTTGDIPLDVAALNEWVGSGGGLLGIHCATDTLKENASYKALIGAAFRDHPWGAGDTVTIQVDDPSHPAAGPYAPRATFQEEIYRFRDPLPDDAQQLLSLDREATPKKADSEGPVPVAWAREHGEGRVLYTSLGHREDVWRSERFQKHLLGAIGWLAAGDTSHGSASAAIEEAAPAQSRRPRDPWVFRSILDGNARMVTIALHEDLWVAYDASDLGLYQAWGGGVELKGAVYDGRHGPQPESQVERLYFQRTGDEQPWRLLKDGEPVEAVFRYRGYRIDNDQITLLGSFTLPNGKVVEVSETPEFDTASNGRIMLRRRFTVDGLGRGYSVQTTTRGGSGPDATEDVIDLQLTLGSDGAAEQALAWEKEEDQ